MSRQRNYAHATSGNALLRLATVEAGFPAGDELGGAQSGVTVCMCEGWRPPHMQTHPGVCGVASP